MKLKVIVFLALIIQIEVSSALEICENIFELSKNHLVADIVLRNGVRPKFSSNRYIVKRGLFEYLGQFESLEYKARRVSLAQELANLGSNDVVIDFGAGEGVAIEQLARMNSAEMIEEIQWRDFADRMDWRGEVINSTKLPYLLKNYNLKTKKLNSPLSQTSQDIARYTPADLDAYLFWSNILSYTDKPMSERPKFLGLTYELTRDPKMLKDVEIKYGKLLEEYHASEIPRFSIGIMYYGVASYSKNWDQMFSILLSRLKVGGKLFIYGAITEITFSIKNETTGVYENQKLKWGEFFRRYAKNIDVQIDQFSSNNIVFTKLNDHVEIPSLADGVIIGEVESPPHFERQYLGKNIIIK